MSLTSQQYAGLADDSYSDKYPARIFPPNDRPMFKYDGVEYEILEHVSNKLNGYQGTIYQRVDTGEIIVAHRGTEGDKKWEGWVKDGLITDGAMVMARVNPQVDDARELTKHAIDRAREYEARTGHAPEVIVIGHSLGGTLAQITAHHFNLRGETFNAYGAASLDYNIPESGNAVLNHVMAADTVSAVSPHYGQVRVYATPQEIASLQNGGYANDRNPLDPRVPLVAAGVTLGSHSMHNFLNVDGDKKPDRSVLADPTTQQLAQVFDPMIDKFRGDLKLGRAVVAAVVRDPIGRVQDSIDYVRGPMTPGEPAAREEQLAQQRAEGIRRGSALEERVQHFRESHSHPSGFPEVSSGPIPASISRPDTGTPGELARPYTLPDYAPPLQTSPHTRSHGSRHRNDEGQESQQEVRPDRNDQAQAFPAHHPNYPLYAALEEKLPGVPKEKIAEITLAANQGDITSPAQLRDVIIHNDQVWVAGRIPGDRANVPLSATAPSIPETLQNMEVFDGQQIQQLAQFQEQQRSINQNADAPGMGARSLG